MVNKDVLINGRIPMSVRKQIKRAQQKGGKRRTLKNKTIKKIKTPVHTKQVVSSVKSNVKGILQNPHNRSHNKTQKRVRFNIESEGIQTGKFRNVHRVKMRTAKVSHLSHTQRKKNHTLKKRGFKIRFSDDESVPQDNSFTGDLLKDLRDVKDTLMSDVQINRVSL